MAVDSDAVGNHSSSVVLDRIYTCGDRFVVVVSQESSASARSLSLVVAFGHRTVARATARMLPSNGHGGHEHHHGAAIGAAFTTAAPRWGCAGAVFDLAVLLVDPAFQGRGLGRMLLRLLEHELLTRHVSANADAATPCSSADSNGGGTGGGGGGGAGNAGGDSRTGSGSSTMVASDDAAITLRVECGANDKPARRFLCAAGFEFPGPGPTGSKALPLSERCTCGACVDGWLSARMRERMAAAADVEGEAMLDLIQETEAAAAVAAANISTSNRVSPLGWPAQQQQQQQQQQQGGIAGDSGGGGGGQGACCWPLRGTALEAALADLPSLRCLPPATQGRVNRELLQGYSECLFSVCEALRAQRLPSVHGVLINWQGEGTSVAARNYFLANGGSVQAALWHVLQAARRETLHGGCDALNAGDDGGDVDAAAGAGEGRWMDVVGHARPCCCAADRAFDLVALHLLGPGYPALDVREGSGTTHGASHHSTHTAHGGGSGPATAVGTGAAAAAPMVPVPVPGTFAAAT